jgi:hypothetical protein
VLYLGPAASMTMAPLDYPRCTEPSYIRMRVERMVLTGSPPAVADRLAQECEPGAKALIQRQPLAHRPWALGPGACVGVRISAALRDRDWGI